MIKTRLIKLLSHSKKYIAYTVFWQWIALLAQVTAVFTVADLLGYVLENTLTMSHLKTTFILLLGIIVIRYTCERMSARTSYLASVDVKRILREKIYDKMLKLGASYSEHVSSSEIV